MFADATWQGDWTLFYWGWWISWSPFVGMFIARISRGRTVREFITGVLLVPTAMTFVILTVFGQTALHMELFGQGGVAAATAESLDFALFALLDELPLTLIMSILAMIVIATFFVTSSDSGSLVDDTLASGGSLNPRWQTRVFWAVAEGAVQDRAPDLLRRRPVHPALRRKLFDRRRAQSRSRSPDGGPGRFPPRGRQHHA
jgi:choline/glycine/proline betaine transport protein